jgi:peptidoglycan hydrolase-like protein with peptidoglycan-binding domain
MIMKKYIFIISAFVFLLSLNNLHSFAQLSTISSCENLKHNLKIGSRDKSTDGEVTKLQSFLKKKGLLDSEPTGYFGKSTKAAVIKYQKNKGLFNSGNVLAMTRGAFNDDSCKEIKNEHSSTSTNISTTSSTTLINNSNIVFLNKKFRLKDNETALIPENKLSITSRSVDCKIVGISYVMKNSSCFSITGTVGNIPVNFSRMNTSNPAKPLKTFLDYGFDVNLYSSGKDYVDLIISDKNNSSTSSNPIIPKEELPRLNSVNFSKNQNDYILNIFGSHLTDVTSIDIYLSGKIINSIPASTFSSKNDTRIVSPLDISNFSASTTNYQAKAVSPQGSSNNSNFYFRLTNNR